MPTTPLPPVSIGPRLVGSDQSPLIVAEVSANHNGDLGRALAIVDAAAQAGAHAIKLQTYRADTITIDCDGPAFRISSGHELWGGKNLYQLYEEAYTPWEWHEPLFARARELGMIPFSSPFDDTAVDLLENLDAPAYKIASMELTDLGLLRRVARTGKPVIVSNGAANLTELDTAIRTLREAGTEQIIALLCTSSYPADPADANLRTLPVLREALGVQVGLSDHTMGIGVPVAAVALGACLVEKHFTLKRADGGVDSAFSLEPPELADLVTETARGWRALGTVQLEPSASERESLRLRRSLYVVADVRAGDTVTSENVRSIRPAGGLAPGYLGAVLGRSFTRDVKRGTALSWDLI